MCYWEGRAGEIRGHHCCVDDHSLQPLAAVRYESGGSVLQWWAPLLLGPDALCLSRHSLFSSVCARQWVNYNPLQADLSCRVLLHYTISGIPRHPGNRMANRGLSLHCLVRAPPKKKNRTLAQL
jgi:hypothetical protein